MNVFCHPDARRDLRKQAVFSEITEDPTWRRDDKYQLN